MIEGSIPCSLTNLQQPGVRIGNPSGVLTVGAKVVNQQGEWKAVHTYSFRTQRRLMEGAVLVPKL